MDKKDNRIVLKGDQVREKLLEGAYAVYETVASTYGPKGRNVLLEKPFGRPILTRDGVTVARDTYFSDRAKNIGAQIVLEASETTNRIAGDGTSGSVVLSYHLMKNGVQAIAGGKHPMEIKKQLFDDSYVLLEKLEKLSTKTKKTQLKEVASVSCGDPLLGQLIAEAIEYVGSDGGIITEKAHVQDVEREYIDGYYLQNGFEALQSGKKELIDPLVIVSTRRLSSSADAYEILMKASQAKGIQPGDVPRFLFIGNIEDAAYNLIVDNINRGRIDAIIIKTPPQFGNMGKDLLEDIAIYAGCEPIGDSTNLKLFSRQTPEGITTTYVGSLDKVIANKSEVTLFADNTTEQVRDRVTEIKDQITVETTDAITEKLKERVAKLEGKIALFKIGGATDSEKEEKEFRVEDAIQATRAAYSHGVVSGGGVTLLELSKTGVSDVYKKALQETFKQLLTNANFESHKFNEALTAPTGFGFNLRGSDELVDMKKAGILDPTLVVEQIIKNATSVSANALTTDTVLIFENKED